MTDVASRVAQLSDEQRVVLLSRLRVARGEANTGEPSPGDIAPVARHGDEVVLSFTQERIWFLEQFAPGTPFHNMSGVARIPMQMDPAIFAECLDDVVQRHEILRTGFVMRDGEPVGVVAGRVTVPVRIVTGMQEEGGRESLFLADARQPFDLSVAPLLRVTIVASDAGECFVQLTMHHLVSDGFSTGVFFHELGLMYRARLTGIPAPFPILPFQFADVAVWERRRLADGADGALLAYWSRHLHDAPQFLALPADHPRPARMTRRGRRLPVEIPQPLVEAVRALSREHGVTPFVTMLAAVTVVLSRFAAQDDLVVGVPTANREEAGTEQIIGPFLNTLAMCFHLGDAPTFAELIQRVNRTVLDGFEHQAVPFERVVHAVQPTRDPSRTPLFQVVFNFQVDRSDEAGVPSVELRDLPNGGCQFDLLFNLVTTHGAMTGHIDYYSDVYDEVSVARIVDSYIAVLSAVATGVQRRVTEIPLVQPQDVATLAGRAIRSMVPHDATRRVQDLVVSSARSHPDRTALVGDGRSLTYGELDARSDGLACQLRARVKDAPGSLVAICLPRSVDMVVAILGVLRAGLAYVPLDPTYPRDRLAFICDDADVAAVVTRRELHDVLPPLDVPTVNIDDSPTDEWLAGSNDMAGADDVTTAEHCAYTIYTSGSTGMPKGVQVSHRNIVNVLESMRRRPGLDEADVLLAVTSPSFDIAALEMLLPLVVGARIVVAAPDDVADGGRLCELLDEHAVTVMQATPTTWQLMVDSGWEGRSSLRALCGGETFPPALASQLLPRCREVWNMYGPTETTIWSTIHRVSDDDVRGGAIPIGRPIRNTTAFVVDRGFNPVPPLVLGELLLGGDGVTIGYHNRTDLTAAQFVESPFTPGTRLYRTGDLVRARLDGILEFAGRLDHQVKIRGFRIELSEIEATLELHPGVGRAVAKVGEDGSGEKLIIGYIEPARSRSDGSEASAAGLSTAELKSFLRERLPEYMVPALMVVVSAFPLTPNGKIDRKSLIPPDEPRDIAADGTSVERAGFAAPRTEVERTLIAIWEDLLGQSGIGVDDSFFELGGHSLLATKLAFRVRQVLDVELPLQVLFEGEPTVARLAMIVTDSRAGNVSVGPKQDLDLAAEARLADDIRPDPGAHVHSVRHPQHLFFTGATGFVGSFLLAELLQTTEATAFCLVRASSATEGHDRIRGALTAYGIWDPAFSERIIPVLGTLSRTRFGVSRAEWQHLAAMVDVIYHSGADVNFLRPYQALKPTNVTGTQELLRLACDGSVKPMHFVSTTYVFSRFSYPAGTDFTEEMEPIHDLKYTFGYTQSKWVSEQMVLEAGRRGLPVYVYRAGRVAGHSQTGACQTYDFVWQATKVGIEIGAVPVMDMSIDITPVDYIVAALAHLSRQPELRGQVFHLVSPDPISEKDLVDLLEVYGYRAERLPFDKWCQRVVQRAAELSDQTAGALAPLLSGTLPLDRIPSARFDCRNVERGLAGTHIVCPPIDRRLIGLYCDYFIDIGYLPPPPDRAAERLAESTQ